MIPKQIKENIYNAHLIRLILSFIGSIPFSFYLFTSPTVRFRASLVRQSSSFKMKQHPTTHARVRRFEKNVFFFFLVVQLHHKNVQNRPTSTDRGRDTARVTGDSVNGNRISQHTHPLSNLLRFDSPSTFLFCSARRGKRSAAAFPSVCSPDGFYAWGALLLRLL